MQQLAIALIVAGSAACVPASWGASALIHPARRPSVADLPPSFEAVVYGGEGVTLSGWRRRSPGPRRGTLVYLHGVADNRSSGIGIADRFAVRGFDVIAYDSRAHGNSGGDACTYGYFEKHDLMRVLDTVDGGPIVLFGVSLGAAVAIQTAALDSRVSAIVGAEVFSDLRSVVEERAPFFFGRRDINRALAFAERLAAFRVAAVSPLDAAARVHAPVLLIHGEQDRDTPPGHSRRVHEALRGPKRLILVPGAGHNESLEGSVWVEIDAWIDRNLTDPTTGAAAASQKDVSPPTSSLSRKR